VEPLRLAAAEGANDKRFCRAAASPIELLNLHVTAMSSKFFLRVSLSWLWPIAAALLTLAGCFGSAGSSSTSGGLADALIPGRKEAQFRDRVQQDSFPTASEAMRSPAQSADK
jgi:hypothetical protein